MDLDRALLRVQWTLHRVLDRVTGGRYDTGRFGLPSLFLTTTGRRSGERRETALFYIERGSDMVVVASNAGSDKPPAWWLNLQANPNADVRRGRRRHAVRARAANAAEEAQLWPRLERGYRQYAEYRRGTTRHIPLVILEPTGETRKEA